ncbi:MAG TPA: serine hydrolase domain-containing protein, partial [Nakamurella sp.]
WQKFSADPRAGWRPEDLLSYAYSEPVLSDPGASFHYSNTNAILLGLLIEKVTGTPLPDFIKDRILTPLTLTSTNFPRDATFATPHAQGYTSQAGAVTEIATDWNPSWAWAAGAMISNVPDLGRWAKEVATGALLSPRTQAERVAFQVSDGGRYGLGLWELDGWVGHSGFLPGYQSLTVYNAAADTTMVVLVNTDIIAAQGTKAYYPPDLIAKEIAEIMTPDHPYDPPPPPAG